MSELPHWTRQYFVPGGGDAFLFYKVYGSFDEPPQPSRSRHRCAGIPDGLAIYEQTPQDHPDGFNFGFEGMFVEGLKKRHPDLLATLKATPQCLVLQGHVADPSDLNYFRDAIGIVTAFLESGGVAVFDPLILRWWTVDEWRQGVFEPDSLEPLRHVFFMQSTTSPGVVWFHSRGMQKFGRPDLSIRGVSPAWAPGVRKLMERFTIAQAQGALVSRGQEVTMASLPSGWRCFVEGSDDDPDFNNRHLYIGPPQLRHLTLALEGIDVESCLAPWGWLIRNEHLCPVAMNYFGDWFFTRDTGAVAWLDTTSGELQEIATNIAHFESYLADSERVAEWFMPDLAFACFEAGLTLSLGQCLSWKIPPCLNGAFDLDNIEVMNIVVHQHLSAQIHEQIKDLPDGAVISGFKIDGEEP